MTAPVVPDLQAQFRGETLTPEEAVAEGGASPDEIELMKRTGLMSETQSASCRAGWVSLSKFAAVRMRWHKGKSKGVRRD